MSSPITIQAWTDASSPPVLLEAKPHVWLVDLSQERGSRESLDASERGRAARFVDPRVRDRWTRAHVALRRILGMYLDVDAAQVRMERAPLGKPRLVPSGAMARSLAFSLSHAEDRALIAVGCGQPLGIDVELVRPFAEMASVVAAYCSMGEQAELAALDPSERVVGFYRCWTRKEAVLKAFGVGLSASLVDVRASSALSKALHLLPGDGYVGALASVGAVSQLNLLRWAA